MYRNAYIDKQINELKRIKQEINIFLADAENMLDRVITRLVRQKKLKLPNETAITPEFLINKVIPHLEGYEKLSLKRIIKIPQNLEISEFKPEPKEVPGFEYMKPNTLLLTATGRVSVVGYQPAILLQRQLPSGEYEFSTVVHLSIQKDRKETAKAMGFEPLNYFGGIRYLEILDSNIEALNRVKKTEVLKLNTPVIEFTKDEEDFDINVDLGLNSDVTEFINEHIKKEPSIFVEETEQKPSKPHKQAVKENWEIKKLDEPLILKAGTSVLNNGAKLVVKKDTDFGKIYKIKK